MPGGSCRPNDARAACIDGPKRRPSRAYLAIGGVSHRPAARNRRVVWASPWLLSRTLKGSRSRRDTKRRRAFAGESGRGIGRTRPILAGSPHALRPGLNGCRLACEHLTDVVSRMLHRRSARRESSELLGSMCRRRRGLHPAYKQSLFIANGHPKERGSNRGRKEASDVHQCWLVSVSHT